MSVINLIKKSISLIYNNNIMVFYAGNHKLSANYDVNTKIKVFTHYAELPQNVLLELKHYLRFTPLYYRLKKRTATLLCYMNDNKILGYGWIQKGKLFKQKYYPILNEHSTVLGPFWVMPEYRRQGIYTNLLAHSLYLLKKSQYPLIIFASITNIPSQKGLEKMGFTSIGIYQTICILGCLVPIFVTT